VRRKVLAADTLVVYVFSDTEEQYSENLRFFLTEAVRAGDGADYFIILQVACLPACCAVMLLSCCALLRIVGRAVVARLLRCCAVAAVLLRCCTVL
jgi:hypothetical protein